MKVHELLKELQYRGQMDVRIIGGESDRVYNIKNIDVSGNELLIIIEDNKEDSDDWENEDYEESDKEDDDSL